MRVGVGLQRKKTQHPLQDQTKQQLKISLAHKNNCLFISLSVTSSSSATGYFHSQTIFDEFPSIPMPASKIPTTLLRNARFG
jgi:hypothetical protein